MTTPWHHWPSFLKLLPQITPINSTNSPQLYMDTWHPSRLHCWSFTSSTGQLNYTKYLHGGWQLADLSTRAIAPPKPEVISMRFGVDNFNMILKMVVQCNFWPTAMEDSACECHGCQIRWTAETGPNNGPVWQPCFFVHFFFLRLRWATPLVSGFCSHSATTYITHFRHLYVNFSVTNVIYARY